MRRKIFDIIEASKGSNTLSLIYDYYMIILIIFSLIPLLFKESTPILKFVETIAVILFIIDYMLRWSTADYKLNKGILSFILYPFTFMAVVDFLSIVPSLSMVNSSFRLFKVFRLGRSFRVFRVFKVIRYSKSYEIIYSVLENSKEPLVAVGTLSIGYILTTALIIFNVEPETFNTFFDAIYWATVSLTTVGYGDIYPVTTIGRVITMISSIFGIAIIALPAGIITAGYMTELDKHHSKNN